VQYLPFDDRTPDGQYQALLRGILRHGERAANRTGMDTLVLMQQVMRFKLANGFPVITDRSLKSFWRKPIGELCAFINGATTLDEFEEFGVNWWKAWATPELARRYGLPVGDIGPASYGGAFHDFPTGEGAPFDQFKNLVEQINDLPDARTHVVVPWIPQWQTRGVGKTPRCTLPPCHGWLHARAINGGLHLHMFQRSGDTPVGVPSNMVQYAALMLMLGHLTGLEPATFYHTISDAHIYVDQIEYVEELLGREPRRLPTVQLNEVGLAVTDIHDFRAEHFELSDYDPHPSMLGIPVQP